MSETNSPRIFAFDVETTGLDPVLDEIIQISYRVLDDQLRVHDSGETLWAWPTGGVCPPEAAAINGFNTEEWTARGALTQEALYAHLATRLEAWKGLMPMGHNVPFDLSFLKALFMRQGGDTGATTLRKALNYHSVDTVSMAVALDLVAYGRLDGGYKLTKLTERFEVKVVSEGKHAHSADYDIDATIELARELVKRLRPENAESLRDSKPAARWSRFMRPMVNGEWEIAQGKHKGRTVRDVYKATPDYLEWMLSTLLDLSPEQRAHVTDLLGVTRANSP
jgi:DNA polymerase III alpha subunit (gram-positive type)